jgi:hypothetical protein
MTSFTLVRRIGARLAAILLTVMFASFTPLGEPSPAGRDLQLLAKPE